MGSIEIESPLINDLASISLAKEAVPFNFPIHWRDSIQYESARVGRVFNHRRPSRYPLGVVEAVSEDHIVEAVQLAKKIGCRVSIRSGGHSWAAWSVRDEAILIDLGKYFHFAYDDASGVVVVSPSTTGRMLNAFLEPKNRMFPGGHCPDVGLGGFLLQGGMGWNCKNWGWACESIVGMDVVTADGEEIHLSAVENPDLFWAARGAGPGFPAVVTRFHLLTRPRQQMFQSLYIYPISEYKNVFQWEIDLCPTAHSSLEIVAVASYLPGDPELTILTNYTCFVPDKATAELALQPIHDSRPPGAKAEIYCKTTSLAEQYCAQAVSNPENHRYCSENGYITNEADVVSVLEEAFTTVPTKKSAALYFSMNPTSRRPLADMALSMQSDHYFALYTVWEDEKDDEKNMAWVHNIMKSVERRADGSYLGDADFQYRRTKFWADVPAARLKEIKKTWDPEGRICSYLDEGDTGTADVLKNEFEWDTIA